MGALEDQKAREAKARADAAAAEAAAAEQARVNAINNQITDLTNKVNACNQKIASLNASKSNITQHVGDWVRVYGSCKSSQMVSKVQVTDKFEGECAKTISGKLQTTLALMTKNQSGIHMVVSGVEAQVANLQIYVNDLKSQISGLRAQF